MAGGELFIHRVKTRALMIEQHRQVIEQIGGLADELVRIAVLRGDDGLCLLYTSDAADEL